MDGRDQSEEGQHVAFLEAGLGLEGLKLHQISRDLRKRSLWHNSSFPHLTTKLAERDDRDAILPGRHMVGQGKRNV